MKSSFCFASRLRPALLALLATVVTGCSSLGAPGPSTRAINSAAGEPYNGTDVAIVELTPQTARRITNYRLQSSFSQTFGDVAPAIQRIEPGDVVGITIWEAPPAVLFGTISPSAGASSGALSSQNVSIPDQVVAENGTIEVPFAGSVPVAGRTAEQAQREIVARLRGQAHDPQALVRRVDNQASTVTVIGKVGRTLRVPLSARGERLLDALAEAGGPTEDVEKTTVRLTRGEKVATMPLDAVVLDPSQNIALQANDVLTVLYQPYSFIALGAIQRNAEVPFEGSGLSLAQALGRIGGLRDDRADVRGVFIFRFEDADALDPQIARERPTLGDGRIPVIYRLDMSEAQNLFAAQDFAIRDDDILYVSTAPGADLQRFLSTLSGVAFSAIAIGNSL